MLPIQTLRMRNAGGGSVNPHALSIYNKIVEWWEGDETSGSVAVGSHAGINGTVVNMDLNQTALASGLAPCMYSAAAGEVTVPYDSALTRTADFAVMAWFNRAATSPNYPVLLWKSVNDDANGRGNYILAINSLTSYAMQLRVNKADGTYVEANGATATTPGVTYLSIGQRVGSDLFLYRNNATDGSNIGNSTTTMTAASGGLYTGTGGSVSSLVRYQGYLGSRAVFSDALTSDERDYLWNSGDGVTYATLKSAAGM